MGDFTSADADQPAVGNIVRGGASGPVVISALAGAGGIGKTALASHWAHRNLDRFPDGQMFVDLQGFSPAGEPVDPAVAVRGFLHALGAAPDRIPTDLAAQAAPYRSLVADRRMLIVLDNAADAITHHGAHHLPVGVHTDAEARQLLIARVGADRVSTEHAAVDELLARCGGLAHRSSRPGSPPLRAGDHPVPWHRLHRSHRLRTQQPWPVICRSW